MRCKELYPSEQKYTLSMEPIGDVHLKDCTISLQAFVRGDNKVEIESSYVIKENDDTLVIVLIMDKVTNIGEGLVKLIVHIGIPDVHFPDGYMNKTYEVWPE